MADRRPNEEEIFKTAFEIKTPEARTSYLELACGDDAALKERIIALLLVTEEEASFLEEPAAAFAVTVTPAPFTETAGTVVGPYKLLQQIGEGGFGVVYMAEQTEPVRRKVALKIIKPGMDTKEVIARFEAERQALALMDHPNIAKVLDAGATESGRPYFVMELVKGVPLTEYCDKNHLSARDRLGLFVSVCHAIQHAHQKGVIHRDLKPSNIMVTLHDGKPVPKVIDFGVSKALSQQLTEKTLFTAYGQMVGTPAYMSPEQAEMSGLDIDTRSDVYSLGVLLYELLTGSTPFDSRMLREAGYAEMQRIIREEEPPKPSTRLTTMGEESTVVSSNRGTDPRKLGQLIRGDLDWIVMKALDKERNRRYETANGFAADIERFLADEPVNACPPSAAYRFRKFARRNKAPMAVTAAALLVLVVVAIGSTIAAGKFRSLAQRNANLVVEKDAALTTAVEAEEDAREAQEEAEDARDKEEELRIEAQTQTEIATDALTDAEQQRERAEANFALARSAVDEFLNEVTENELLTVPGMQPLRQELLSSAMKFYEDFAQDEANASELLVELASAHHRIAVIRSELGQTEASTASNEKSIELFEQLHESGNDSLEVRLGLARSYFRAKRYDDTVTLCEEIREDDPQDAETRSLLANTYNMLAIQDKNDDDIPAALAYHRQALALRESLVQDFPDKADCLAELGSTVNNLGVIHQQQGNHRQALEMYERAVGYTAEAYTKKTQTITWGRWLCIGLRNVARQQARYGEQDEALEAYRRVVAVRRKLAFDNPAVPSLKGELFRAWYDLASYQRTLGLASEAGRSFRRAEEILDNIDTNTPSDLFNLAIVYGALATPLEGAADEPDEEAQAEMQRYADLAMETIDKAVLEGYRDLNMVKNHTYLAVVRNRERFQQLMVWLEAEVLASSEAAASEQTLAERREALAALRELIGDEPADARHRRTLAATLHSIARIETELGQFDAAEEALAEELTIREELQQDEPENARHGVDLGAVFIAMGDVCWKSTRFPLAREQWKTGLELLQTAISLAPGDDELETQVANQELIIFRRYGEAGLWDWAAEYCERVLRRDNSYDGHWDHRFAHLLAALGRLDEHAALWQLLADKWSESRPADVQWAAVMTPRNVLESADLVELAEQVIEPKDNHAPNFFAASAFYRAGQYERALELMSGARPRDFVGPHHRYWYAMVDHKLGNTEQAEHMLEQGEIAYRDIALRCLEGPAATGVLNGHYGYWQAWAEDQAIRQQAWNEVHGHNPPDDPWQHLIQARAYQTIGETELADTELAAAASAALGNEEALLAHQRLVEEWDEIRNRFLTQQLEGERDTEDIIKTLLGDDPDDVRHERTMAATLHSIGDIQMELKEYEDAQESLQQALEMLQSLIDHYPDDSQVRFGLLEVQYSLGRWNWVQEDYPEAHQHWQECLAGLLQLAETNRDDRDLQKELSIQERKIYQHYGRIGAFPLVQEYAARSVETDRVWSHEDVPELASEGEFSAVILMNADEDLARSYFRQIRDSLRDADFQWKIDVIHLVRSIAALGETELLSEELISHYQGELENSPHQEWIAVGMAMVHYSHELYAEARAAIENFRESHTPQLAFLDAAIASKLGDRERAQRRWSEGEDRYRQMCSESLVRDVTDSNTGVFGRFWWQYAYDRAMRRLALEAMSEEITGDPWQHLIQARGYQLIGETELAEAELAAADAVAPDDSEIRVARAELLERWHDAERAEVDWQRAVDLAGDDPMPWIHRGRWYAQHGEQEQADADFLNATELTDHLNPFLEAGWWVVGPVPGAVESTHPLENNPDPSTPVTVGEGQDPITWRRLPTERFGFVNLTNADVGSEPAAQYALGYVYCDRPRQAPLLIGGHGTARVWVNGRIVTTSAPMASSEFVTLVRQPVSLRAGRNTVLVRLWAESARRDLYVRFPEGPLDRAIDFLKAGLYPEAVDLFDAGLHRPPEVSTHPWLISTLARIAKGVDPERYGEYVNRVFQRYDQGTNKHGFYNIAVAAGFAREEVIPYDRLLTHAQQQLTIDPTSWVRLHALSLALYRGGQFNDALDRLQLNANVQQTWPMQALIHHRLGDLDVAQQRLDEAQRWYRERLEAFSRGATKDQRWEVFVAMLREATEEIDGRPLDPEPQLHHLWRARSLTDFGMFAEAETELQAALASGADEQAIRPARVRLLVERSETEDVEADWQKLIESAGDDPMPWIQRGRWYAERGEQDQADADFARAASLTPNELNRFLEAGWWVVGPYPADLARFCPPEFNPDPSRPVYTIDPGTGLSDVPAAWASVPTGEMGQVDLSAAPGRRDGGSVYAMAHLYSPDERSVMLMIDKWRAWRVWVNGVLIEDFEPGEYPIQPHYEWCNRLPVVLRAGRNTILVKSATPTLTVRLGDSPQDQVQSLAEQLRFSEALEVLDGTKPTSGDFDYGRPYTAWLSDVLAGSDSHVELYGQISARFAGRERRSDHLIPRFCAQRPNPAFDSNIEDLVWSAEQFMRETRVNWSVFNAALLNFRAGNLASARTLLEEADWKPHAFPLLALLDDRAGDPSSATESLAAAISAGTDITENLRDSDRSEFFQPIPFHWWYNWAQYLNLLREAEQAIRDESTASDQLRISVAETMKEKWTTDPDLVPYDRAILFTARGGDGQLQFPQPLLARGRRLAELGRFDEAEADFNMALSLSPDNPDVRAPRAEFFARRGEADRASGEFARAFGQSADHPVGRLLEAQHSPDVLHTWNFARGDEGWNQTHQCLLDRSEGVLMVSATGADPHFYTSLWAPAGWKELTICARVNGDHTSQIFWTTSDARTFSEDMQVQFPLGDSAGQWREYRVYFQPDTDLLSLRLDPANRADIDVDIAWMTLAHRSLDDAIEANPESADLYAMRAQWLGGEHRWHEAAADINTALELQPDNHVMNSTAGFVTRTWTYAALGEYDEALAACDLWLEHTPDSQDAINWRHHIYRWSGQFGPALAQATALYEDDATRTSGLFKLAATHVALENWPAAIAALDEVVQENPARWVAWYCRSLLCKASENDEELVAMCAKLIQQHGETSDANSLSGVFWSLRVAAPQIEDRQLIVSVAERAYADPTTPREFYHRAVAYYHNAQYDQALAALNRALELHWNFHEFTWLYLAMTHQQLGNTEEARNWFDKAAAVLDQPPAANTATFGWGNQLELQLLRREAEALLGIVPEQTAHETREPAPSSPSTGS